MLAGAKSKHTAWLRSPAWAKPGKGGNFLQDSGCSLPIVHPFKEHSLLPTAFVGLPPGQAGPAFHFRLFHSHLAGLWSCLTRGAFLPFSKSTSLRPIFPPTPLPFFFLEGC